MSAGYRPGKPGVSLNGGQGRLARARGPAVGREWSFNSEGEDAAKLRAGVARWRPRENDGSLRRGGLGDGEAWSLDEGDSRIRWSLEWNLITDRSQQCEWI